MVFTVLVASMLPVLWLVLGLVCAFDVYRDAKKASPMLDSVGPPAALDAAPLDHRMPTPELSGAAVGFRALLGADIEALLVGGAEADTDSRFREANSDESVAVVLGNLGRAVSDGQVPPAQAQLIRSNMAVNLALYGSTTPDEDLLAVWEDAVDRIWLAPTM